MKIAFPLDESGDFLLAVEITHTAVVEVFERGEKIPNDLAAVVREAAEEQNVFLFDEADGLYVPSGPLPS